MTTDMQNDSLDQMLKARGIEPDSSKAEKVRHRCRFISTVSDSDLDFILERIEEKAQKVQVPHSSVKKDQPELFSYGKSVKYVSKHAPQLDATMLVANLEPNIEKGNDFFYI